MHILVAPDSFKGSITARQFCDIAAEVLSPCHQVTPLPMADGGEGTCECLVLATGGTMHTVTVSGPMGTPVEAFYGVLGDGTTAVMEMASASGLPLVPPAQRNIFAASTRGFGELILAALDRGCRSFIMGIGGSATNDGGAGMAAALGARLLDEHGQPVPDGAGGLAKLHRIDISQMDSRLQGITVEVACDVNAPLCGPRGASCVFGPQKGARPEDVPLLDETLRRYGQLLLRDLGRHVAEVPGSGAAGGLGAGLMAFLSAQLLPGFDIISRVTGFETYFTDRKIDLVITGEGQISAQSLMGKLPVQVAETAARHGVPAVAIVGSIAADAAEAAARFAAVHPLMTQDMTLQYAMAHGPQLLREKLTQLDL